MKLTSEIINGIIIFWILFLETLGVAIAVIMDKTLGKKRRTIMLCVIFLAFCLVLQNNLEYILVEYVFAPKWRILVATIGYTLRPAIIVCFIYMAAPERKHGWAWIPVAINCMMYITSFFSDIVFTIGTENNWYGGPLSNLCLVISSLLLAYHVFVSIREYLAEKKLGALMPLVFVGVVVVGVVFDIFQYYQITHWVDYVTIATVACCVFYYFWVHFLFERRYQNALLAEQRFQTMLSQMQPHFIYNSLSAIAEIEGVPEKAQAAIVDFSKYLRENLDAMTSSDLISLGKELEHVKKYVSLEILRFGEDKINVVFDIQNAEVMLPPLTVQVLVENAIKHGITQKYEGGTVRVISTKENGFYVISVEDDGIGFDPQEVKGEKHVGLANVRKRLEYLVNGKLLVDSMIGEGTIATIMIPVGNKE